MYLSFQVGLNIQYHTMVKEEKPKVEGGTKQKRRFFQQSTSTRKSSFKLPMTGLEEKVYDFGKHKHKVDFVKKYKAIVKYI